MRRPSPRHPSPSPIPRHRRHSRLVRGFLLFPLVVLLAGVGPAARSGGRQLDLTAATIGEEPECLSIIDGEFRVAAAEDGTRFIEVSPTPLTESGALFGETVTGDATAAATFLASRRGRSTPRFGIGLHGISGHRLRVVPSTGGIELVFREEVVATAAYDWKSDAACRLELRVRATGSGEEENGELWSVEAFAWEAEQPRPEKPQLSLEVEEKIPARGKASVWATPYSGLPVRIFDIESPVLPRPTTGNDSAGESNQEGG